MYELSFYQMMFYCNTVIIILIMVLQHRPAIVTETMHEGWLTNFLSTADDSQSLPVDFFVTIFGTVESLVQLYV